MIQRVPERLKVGDRLPPSAIEPQFSVPPGPLFGKNQTDAATLDACLKKLAGGSARLARMSVEQRIRVLEQCVDGIASVASEWVETACDAKGIPAGSPSRAEEILGGPVSAMRQLQLFCRTMRDIARTGAPRLSGIVTTSGGRLGVRVTPCAGLFDPLVFFNFRATTWLSSEITRDTLRDSLAPAYRDLEQTGTSLVLGAGNVSGIPASDMLSKLCVDNRAVLLKMNPVNEYLGSIFERAFAPLVENDLLRVVYGDASVAASAIADPRITDLHITGSTATHDAIVWGTGPEAEQRRAARTPLLDKPISSELGNVSPWIVVPGSYSCGTLRAQAGNVVSSMTNNAAFNCIATRVIVTWKQWPDRERFLTEIESLLAGMPQRKAYYPGSFERYERFTGQSPARAQSLLRKCSTSGGMCGSTTSTDGSTTFVAGTGRQDDSLPWTLIRNLKPDSHKQLLCSESFVCVCVEVPLDADDPADFLHKATEFANRQLWGTLAASLTVPFGFRRNPRQAAALDESIRRLEYGIVSQNQWAGIGFALMSPPWGGYPGSGPEDIRSGSGWVHNSLMLTHLEKTVVEAPLRVLPKPVWSPTHSSPERVSWALFELMRQPSWLQMAGLGIQAGRAGV